jgi:predicted transcriptional regulator
MNNSTSERALTLLSQGVPAEAVAATLGVTPSRISQLLSDPEFASTLQEKKFESLQKHNERDSKLDALEDKLIEKLDKNLPLMMRPMELVRTLQVVNGAKRRGASAPTQLTAQQTIINLTLPTQIINQFKTNAQNQVTETGQQSLLTMQSSSLLTKLKGATHDSVPALSSAQPG